MGSNSGHLEAPDMGYQGRVACLLGWLWLGLVLGPAALAQNVQDGFMPTPDGTVSALAVQADGKLLVGGSFTTIDGVTRIGLARLHADGSIDHGFNASLAAGAVHAILVLPDQRILIGGTFTQVGLLQRHRLARLNADGSVDASFSANTDGTVRALARQSDGRILVGGSFENLGGLSRSFLARLTVDGAVDPDFSPHVSHSVRSLLVQSNRHILAGGTFTTVNGLPRRGLVRLDFSGNVDAAFDQQLDGSVRALGMQVDGNVVIGGLFDTVHGLPRKGIARLQPDGSLDMAFNANSDGSVLAIAIAPDGRIVAGGLFGSMCGAPHINLVRFVPAGGCDPGFTAGVDKLVNAIVVQPDDKIVVGGQFNVVAGYTAPHQQRLARFYPDGSLDRTLSPGINSIVVSMALQPDGKILVGGGFLEVDGHPRPRIARLNADGTLDDFHVLFQGSTRVNAIAVQPDGKILIGGAFSQIDNQDRNHIARLNADGSLDSTFNPGADSYMSAFALQPDGKLLVGGAFTQVDGQSRSRIARLNPNGTLDAAFSVNIAATDTIPHPHVAALALQSDGKIVVGGIFREINGQQRNGIARLNSDGTLDVGFNPATVTGGYMHGYVLSVTLQADKKILIGGFVYYSIGDQARYFIARLNADGTLDNAFDPDSDQALWNVVAQSDGAIWAGGEFTVIGGQPRAQIALLNVDGSADNTIDPGADDRVEGIILQPDGKVLMGGLFSTVGGQTRMRIARLSSHEATLQSLSLDGDVIRWMRSGPGPEIILSPELQFSLNGTSFNTIATMARIAGGWSVSGFEAPTDQIFYLRVRARVGGGGRSQGLIETTRQFYVIENDIFADRFQAGN
jgi:uncharacterized delta-60 repeat protein